MVRSDCGELGFEEPGDVGAVGCVFGGEDGAFVGDVAEDGGNADVAPTAEKGDGEIRDEVVVECGVVREQWLLWGAGEGDADVVALHLGGGEGAEASECAGEGGVVVALATRDECVVHELGFGDVEHRRKRLGFSSCGVEEPVVSASVCCHEQCD